MVAVVLAASCSDAPEYDPCPGMLTCTDDMVCCPLGYPYHCGNACYPVPPTTECSGFTVCAGGSPSSDWDGTYAANVHTVTPAGTTDLAGTFSCTGGFCSSPDGAFSGTVDVMGEFSGSSVVCQGCNPLAMSGTFLAGVEFEINGASGNISQTIRAHEQ